MGQGVTRELPAVAAKVRIPSVSATWCESGMVDHSTRGEEWPMERAVPTQTQSKVSVLDRFLMHESIWGYVLVTPIVIRLVVFSAGPIIASFFLSLTDYPLIEAPTWIGLDNYLRALGDEKIWAGLQNTLKYIAFSVPTSLIISLTLAIALNQKIRGIVSFRVLFFLPVVS